MTASWNNLRLIVLILDALALPLWSLLQEIERTGLTFATVDRPVGVEFPVLRLDPPITTAAVRLILDMHLADFIKVSESGLARPNSAAGLINSQEGTIDCYYIAF